MGTHPIFESDFDCLTDLQIGQKYATPGRFRFGALGIAPFATLTTQPGLLGGKVHGSLARAGKVKGQTPKVDAEEKKKAKTGRAKRRMQYNRRFVNVVPSFGKKKGPNSNS